MSNVKFKGETIKITGNGPEVGEVASNFSFVKDDLSEGKLYDFEGKSKVIIAFPSIDTGVCQAEARKFNEKLNGKGDVVGLIVARDLPFAMKRFCSAEGLDTIVNASDFRYNDFADKYNLLMDSGPLKGLFTRAVLVVDKNNKVVYKEIVEEVTEEPDYAAAMNAVESL